MELIERIREALAIAMYYRDQVEAYANGRHVWPVASSSNTLDCRDSVTTLRAAA